MKYLLSSILIILLLTFVGCDPNSDAVQQQKQEVALKEGVNSVGLPAIKNWREMRILKDIYELCDQDGLVTYTYVFSEMTGKYTYLGETVGYGIPYSTQFSNPTKPYNAQYALSQAEPNGLFKPTSAEGTWILMRDPINKVTRPQYIEPKISTFTYKLPASMVIAGY